MLRLPRLITASLAVIAIAAVGCGGSDEDTQVSAYPSPGTPAASPQTSITLVGLDPDDPGEVTVTGSKSGSHQGEIKAIGPSTKGVVFVPDKPFAPREDVNVEIDGKIAGIDEGGAYSFKTASFRTDAALPPKVLPPESRIIRSQSFRSRPDLEPPVVDIKKQATDQTHDGHLFLSPKIDGPMIIDPDGELVYFRPSLEAADFRVQSYQDKPVLTWWEGPFNAGGYTEGTNVIADENYEEIARVPAGNGYQADLHEFKLTDRGTAYLTIYKNVLVDLSEWGGPKHGAVLDSVAQEIDIDTGEVVWEWHSVGNVPLGDTYIPFPESPTEALDYFHINSLDEDKDGNILISGRNTFSVVKADKETGETIWTLGGKNSDFEMGEGTDFTFQHDALRQEDGTLTVYDNATTYGQPPNYPGSRGLVLDLDEENMTAELAEPAYVHPDELLAPSQGNMQKLANSNYLIGWGSEPWFTEFTPDGEVQLDGTYYARNSSYRTYRDDWTGKPVEDPAIATEGDGNGKVNVWMSWNGATDVDSWRVLSGPTAEELEPGATVPREGFETMTEVESPHEFFAVEALDSDGEVLATSATIGTNDQHGPNGSV